MGISNELDLIESFLENTFQRAALSTGFNNYHTISVCDHVHVPKFWSIWCMWVYTKKYISDVIPKGMLSGGGWGGWGVTAAPPPPHTHTHNTHSFLKFVSILTKYVGKISRPNVVGKFRVFYQKNEMQNSINIQSHRNQTFTSDDGF